MKTRTKFELKLYATILERNLSRRTYCSYLGWAKSFYSFTGKGFRNCTGKDVSGFLTHLNRKGYSASSRKQAKNAVMFVLLKVFGLEVDPIGPAAEIRCAKPPVIAPTKEEVFRIFSRMTGTPKLMAQLMYASGLRISECQKLRVKDFNFEDRRLYIYEAKGSKHRTTVLPEGLDLALKNHLQWRESLHIKDLSDGNGQVELPGRYGNKHKTASADLAWQFVFPSVLVNDGFRWYTSARLIQKNFKEAVKSLGIQKRLTPHSLRKGFATHLYQSGTDIRSIQKLLGHAKLETTLTYIEASSTDGILSPFDRNQVEILKTA